MDAMLAFAGAFLSHVFVFWVGYWWGRREWRVATPLQRRRRRAS